MYESPIELFTKTVAPKISETVDGMILKAVIDAGIEVDRDELIKALAYDRNQYEKGFEDGKAEAMKWISVKDRLPEKLNENNQVYLTEEVIGSDGESAYIGQFKVYKFDGHRKFFDGDRFRSDITHWMPLPEPPKEE